MQNPAPPSRDLPAATGSERNPFTTVLEQVVPSPAHSVWSALPGMPPSGGPVRLLVHRWALVHRNGAFWRGRAISQGSVWPDRVEVNSPPLDNDPGLAQGVEQLTVHKYILEAGVEAFTGAVLPGNPGSMQALFYADCGDPVPHLLGNDLRAIV